MWFVKSSVHRHRIVWIQPLFLSLWLGPMPNATLRSESSLEYFSMSVDSSRILGGSLLGISITCKDICIYNTLWRTVIHTTWIFGFDGLDPIGPRLTAESSLHVIQNLEHIKGKGFHTQQLHRECTKLCLYFTLLVKLAPASRKLLELDSVPPFKEN